MHFTASYSLCELSFLLPSGRPATLFRVTARFSLTFPIVSLRERCEILHSAHTQGPLVVVS